MSKHRPAGQGPRRRWLSLAAGCLGAAVVLVGFVVHRVGGTSQTSGAPAAVAVEPTSVSSSPCPAQTAQPVSPSPGTLIAMKMLSQHTGWLAVTYFAPDSSGAISGGSERVFRTVDCGHSWADVTPAQLGDRNGIVTLTAVDNEHAWLVTWEQNGTPTVAQTWRTSDGGATWQRTDVSVRPQGDPTVFFLDRQIGWMGIPVAGLSSRGNVQAKLFSTSDGGASWTLVEGGLAGHTVPVAGVQFTDRLHGWGLPDGSQGGDLYRTDDGGRSWTRSVLPSPQRFSGQVQAVGLPTFTTAGDGVLPVRLGTASDPFPVSGHEGTAKLDFYTTHDGGGAWTPTTPLSGVPAATAFVTTPSVGVLSATHWIVATEATLYSTTDAGRTWQAIPSTMGLPASRGPNYPRITLVAGSFPSQLAWWVAYSPLGCIEGCDLYGLVHTADGGRTWSEDEPATPQ